MALAQNQKYAKVISHEITLFVLWSWLLIGVVAFRAENFSCQDIMIFAAIFMMLIAAPVLASSIDNNMDALKLAGTFTLLATPALAASFLTVSTSWHFAILALVLLFTTTLCCLALTKRFGLYANALLVLWFALPILAEYLTSDVLGSRADWLDTPSPIAVFTQPLPSNTISNGTVAIFAGVLIFVITTTVGRSNSDK